MLRKVDAAPGANESRKRKAKTEAIMTVALLTKAEAADMLHCSIRHLERMMGEGLPFIPIGSRKKLFCTESITRWLMAREVCIAPTRTKSVRRQQAAPNAYLAYCEGARIKREAREQKRRAKKAGAR